MSITTGRVQASAPRSGGKQCLLPSEQEVVVSVRSLYVDELKPYGRLVRKRIAERHAERISSAVDSDRFDVDMRHLRAVCDACSQLHVEPEEGGDWSVTIVDRHDSFVDIYSAVDVYPEQLWSEAAEVFATDNDMTLTGGRYSCARSLLARDYAFLKGRTLGQVCHIVQLAMTQRKVLGYLNGSVVPYGRSQSMVKETCAGQQQPRTDSCLEAASLPFATWDTARSCLRTILEEARCAQDSKGPGVVPLSDVKRQFRSQFQLELSETMFGYSKLSVLLQDARFSDVCAVQLEGHGYTVVQVATKPRSHVRCVGQWADASDEQDDGQPEVFPDDHSTILDFGQTPFSFGTAPMPQSYAVAADQQQVEQSSLGELLPLYLSAVYSTSSSLEDYGAKSSWTDEPLRLDDAAEPSHCPVDFGPTPGPFGPSPFYEPAFPSADDEPWPSVSASMSTSSTLHSWGKLDRLVTSSPTLLTQPRWPALSPWKDGKLSGMVQNTFIHATMPPPTPMPGTLRRASSMGDLRESHYDFTDVQPLSSSVADAASDGLSSSFCPGEPLCLEDAETSECSEGVGFMLAAPRPSVVRWPALSPWKDGKLNSMVQNTFIHAAQPPPTPAPGALRRSRSMGDLTEATALSHMFTPLGDSSMPTSPALLVPPSPSLTASPELPSAAPAALSAPRPSWMPLLCEYEAFYGEYGVPPPSHQAQAHAQPPVLRIADFIR